LLTGLVAGIVSATKGVALHIIERLRGSLIVSCQPVPGGPLDRPEIVVGFALAALASGAAAVRIEGIANVAAVRAATRAPIIGLVKRDFPGTPVRITALLEDVDTLAAAGADIIAIDATACPHPVPAADLLAAIRRHGRLAMADISNAAEAEAAVRLAVDCVGTTLSGYTGGAVPDLPDFALIAAIARCGRPVIAEGRIRTPDQARAAIEAGAHAVVVGSAITRPEHITEWFATAVAQAVESRAA
jgi:N-acetylmannosamine-6-phosphate 2-epimerase/N-acetylmannosamine kinase